jgi:hypothetical protein
MKNGSFTAGTTPEAVIRKALRTEQFETYYMELVGDDADLLVKLRNQGIDSHLQAVTGDIGWNGRRLRCDLDHDGVICLLRRLHEISDSDAPESSAASSLRSSILTTLEIEEI